MEGFLNLIFGYFGGGKTPLHKPYPYSWNIGVRITSILGTNEMLGEIFSNWWVIVSHPKQSETTAGIKNDIIGCWWLKHPFEKSIPSVAGTPIKNWPRTNLVGGWTTLKKYAPQIRIITPIIIYGLYNLYNGFMGQYGVSCFWEQLLFRVPSQGSFNVSRFSELWNSNLTGKLLGARYFWTDACRWGGGNHVKLPLVTTVVGKGVEIY